MHTPIYPPILHAPTSPGAIPCFVLSDGRAQRRGRPTWDQHCTAILTRLASRHGNAEVADLIAAETGMRFKEKTVSERRSDLGLQSPRCNDWTAPLRRWEPWQGG